MSNLPDNTSKKHDDLTFNESAMEYLDEYDNQFNDLDDDQPTVDNVLSCMVSKSIINSVEKCSNKTPTNNIQTFNLQNVKKSKHKDTVLGKDSQNTTIILKESMSARELVNLENNTKAKTSIKNTSCNFKNNKSISEIESSSLAYKTNSISNRDNINNTQKSHSKQFEQNLKKTMPTNNNEIHNNVSAFVKNSIAEKEDDLNMKSAISKYAKKTNNVSKFIESTNAKKYPSVQNIPRVTKKSKHSKHKKNSITTHVLLEKVDSLKSPHKDKPPVVNNTVLNTIEAELNKLHGGVNDNSFSSNQDKNSICNDTTLKINNEFDDSDTEHIYLQINEIISSNKSPVKQTKSLTDSALETKNSSIETNCVEDSVVKNNINMKTKQCAFVYGNDVSTQSNLPSLVIDPGECTNKLSKHNIPISDLSSVNKSKHRDVAPDNSQSNTGLINESVSSRDSNFENNSSVQNVQVNMDHVNINACVLLDNNTKVINDQCENEIKSCKYDGISQNISAGCTSVNKQFTTSSEVENSQNSSSKITPNMFEMHNTNTKEHTIEKTSVTDTLTKTNNHKALTLNSFIKEIEVKYICYKINGIISEHIKNVVDESTKNVITSELIAKSFVDNDSITNSSSNIDKSNIFKKSNKSCSTGVPSDDPSKETEVQKHFQNSIFQHTNHLDNSTSSVPTIVKNIIHNLINNKTDLTKKIVQAFGIPYESSNSNEVNVTENVDKTQNNLKTIMDTSSDNPHYESTLENISSSSKTQLNSATCMQPDNNVHSNTFENQYRERKKSRSTSPLPPINEWIQLMKDFNKAVKKASVSKVDVNIGTMKKAKFQQGTILENLSSNSLNIEDNALENKSKNTKVC